MKSFKILFGVCLIFLALVNCDDYSTVEESSILENNMESQHTNNTERIGTAGDLKETKGAELLPSVPKENVEKVELKLAQQIGLQTERQMAQCRVNMNEHKPSSERMIKKLEIDVEDSKVQNNGSSVQEEAKAWPAGPTQEAVTVLPSTSPVTSSTAQDQAKDWPEAPTIAPIRATKDLKQHDAFNDTQPDSERSKAQASGPFEEQDNKNTTDGLASSAQENTPSTQEDTHDSESGPTHKPVRGIIEPAPEDTFNNAPESLENVISQPNGTFGEEDNKNTTDGEGISAQVMPSSAPKEPHDLPSSPIQQPASGFIEPAKQDASIDIGKLAHLASYTGEGHEYINAGRTTSELGLSAKNDTSKVTVSDNEEVTEAGIPANNTEISQSQEELILPKNEQKSVRNSSMDYKSQAWLDSHHVQALF